MNKLNMKNIVIRPVSPRDDNLEFLGAFFGSNDNDRRGARGGFWEAVSELSLLTRLLILFSYPIRK